MVMNIAWSPDGRWLASGGGTQGSGKICIWDAQSWERLHVTNEPNSIINALVWNATGSVLVSGGSDGNLRWWDVQFEKCLALQQGHQGAVQSFRMSPNNQRLASCGDDNTIQIWNLESGEHLQTLRSDRPYERLNITGLRGITRAQLTTLRALGAIEDTALQCS
jgi:WD40 repeat protein